MNKKQMSKRQRDIKSKLMAAVAMLLVSSIMMVSTTYAWFTLSTAPEVTGINTAVGANGNLEMALQPYSGDSATIQSTSGDGVKPVKEKNVTWGNLVDLGAIEGTGTTAHNVYGLDKITLYPSALNVTADKIGANPLQTPTYGADGRVATLVSKTITGVYQDQKFVENVEGTTNGAKGVRAVGISSGMSERELAYRGAKASASSADTTAKDTAATALRTHGNVLADVAISHALKSDGAADNPYYTEEQVAAMRSVLTALVGDADTEGAFDQIGDALLQYVYADTLATASDADFESIKTAFASLTLDSVSGETPFKASYEKMVVTENGVPVNLFTKLNTAKSAAATALSKLPAANEDGPFAWNQISDALGGLVNVNHLKINEMTVAQVQENPGTVAGSIMKNGLKLYMASGAGVFADIADFCGDYSASITIDKLSYDKLEVEDVEATMLTQTSAKPVYLQKALQTVGAFSGTGASTTKSITEFYGYIIDMAFRTNASGSFLQLQKDGIDRIYNQQNNQGTNPETMGGGAYMQFTTQSQTFTQQAMENLMAAIRIVFFDTDSMAIKGYARLDKDHVAPDTSAGVKMPIIMTDAAGTALTDNAGTTNKNEAVTIMELTQNQVHELSVLVYLDGNVVGNDDVATDVAQSMTGTMNLQFSSSATLVPMEYKDLKEGTSSVTPTEPTRPNDAVDVNASINNGYAVTGGKGVYTASLKTAVVHITDTADPATPVTTGTVTINGVTATHQGEGAWSATIDTAPESLAVVVTPAT